MRTDLAAYRASHSEQERIADLFALLPLSGKLALDIGARDGYLANLLAERFDKVVALDLTKPDIDHPKIQPLQGDATCLQFSANQFDVVLCAEVLEHLLDNVLAKACSEIARVAGNYVVIGVPYRQDLRCGRTTCQSCGGVNPPWGHVNSFDEARLRALFPSLTWERSTFVGSNLERTNFVSAALLDFAGNPFGTWLQDEPCVHCGQSIGSAKARSLEQRLATRAAFILNRLQASFLKPQANWIHVLFSKHSAKLNA